MQIDALTFNAYLKALSDRNNFANLEIKVDFFFQNHSIYQIKNMNVFIKEAVYVIVVL